VHLFRRRLSRFDALRANLQKGGRLVVTGWNLEGIDLSRRALLGVEFRDCELAFANFAGSDLSLARFVNCNLYLADFSGSVLYTTWFYECNLTKASFEHAYLLGFRLRNADITKASFDDIPAVGLERKVRAGPVPGALHVSLLGLLPSSASQLEEAYRGVGMDGYSRTVVFMDKGENARFRTRLRVAETAKYLRTVHAENGYESRADHYYVIERRQRRQALHGSLLALTRRAHDFLFGDLVWRYGASVIRPLVALVALAVTAAGITYLAPLGGGATGLHPGHAAPAYTFTGLKIESFVNYLNVLYFFLTSPAGGSGDELTGWAKGIFVVYILSALWLIALVFESSSRHLGRSK
jgi:pentapeptide repeat protein